MKPAMEMFEELGFVREVSKSPIVNRNFIKYKNKKEDKSITFRRWFKDFYAFECGDAMEIDMLTFKAIHKQLEELGWLE